MRSVRTLLVLLLLALCSPAFAAKGDVHWTAQLVPPDARAGEGAQVALTARIEGDYHLYSLTKRDTGPNVTTLTLATSGPLAAAGAGIQPPPHTELDQGFGINVESYTGGVAFGLPVTIKPGLTGAQSSSVSVHFQVCREGTCLLPKTVTVPVTFTLAPGPPRQDHLAALTTVPQQPTFATTVPSAAPPAPSAQSSGQASGAPPADAEKVKFAKAESGGLLSFIVFAVGAGFLALLTPCVFPMVPLTVSIFTKRKDHNPKLALRDALAYCFGIVGTFTLLGLIVTAIFGAAGISNLATNPFINVGLALLFVALAANLLGAFEITALGGLANKAQAGTGRGGIIGPMLMGLTFSLTSFTCTVAFVGTLLASAAAGGRFYPIVGMLAFSSAFASPFFLLALFPQYLSRLPKSGSWLVTVKAYLGIIEIAAALKFFSNADLVWHLGVLTRPVFLALWAMIGVVAGLYMLGWLRLKVDDAPRIGWTRRAIGLVTAVAGIYCLAAIEGAPLGDLDAYIPARPYPGRHVASDGAAPTGITWGHDYAAAVARSKAENKPLFINFTGYTCTNCRLMEQKVFPTAAVQRDLASFIPVELYTDDDRVGEANQKIEQKLTGVLTLPVYVIVRPDGTVANIQQGAEFDAVRFAQFVGFGLPKVASAAQ